MISDVVIRYFKREGIPFSVERETIEKESRDMTHMSPFLSKFSEMIADIVTYPRSEEDVLKIVEICIDEHIPIIPRGGGMNNIGGLVPLKGGIIVDTRGLNKFILTRKEVIGEPGTKYFERGKFNFAPRIYPSSFEDGVTIGGHIEGGCCGIGSFKYGWVWDQITELRIVDPTGKIRILRGGDVKIASHAEGTTGIITRVRLLRENEEYVPHVIEDYSFEKLLKEVEKAFDEGRDFYHVTLRSPQASNITNVMPTDKWQLFIAHSKEEKVEGIDGKEIWDKKHVFYGGVTKAYWRKIGSVYYMIKDIDVSLAGDVISRLPKDVITQVEFIAGRVAHIFILTDTESKYKKIKEEMKKLEGKIFELHDLRINSRLDSYHLQRIVQFKRKYDKEDLFNPGKVEFIKP